MTSNLEAERLSLQYPSALLQPRQTETEGRGAGAPDLSPRSFGSVRRITIHHRRLVALLGIFTGFTMGRKNFAGAPSAAPTEQMMSATRAAVMETTGQVPSGEPLTVTPAEAPAGTIDDGLLPLIIELRMMMTDVAKENKEAAAHLDDYTLARFLIARESKLADAAHMFRETMTWRASRGVNAIRRELHPSATYEDGTAGAVKKAARAEHFFAGFGGCARDGSPFFIERLGRFDVNGVNHDAAVYDFMMVRASARVSQNVPCV